MPIWIELMVLMLVAYVAGLGFGWALWRRRETEADTDG